MLDFEQPVALMLLGVLHLIQDAEDPWHIVDRLMAAMWMAALKRTAID